MPKLGVVLFSNVGAYRVQEMIEACAHMPYRVWSEPSGDGSFEIRCDKSVRILSGGGEGREASGDAGSARRKPEAHAAQRRPGSNPGRSTVISLSKLFSG